MGTTVPAPMAAPRRSADRALLRDRPARSVATKQAAVLNADEVAALIDCASPRDAALIALMAAGAMRVGEATLLCWGDVDGCVVTITAAHEAGLSLKAVAEISGHKSIGALERYLDQGVAKEKAEEARGLLFASL
jgi:integrase